MPAAGFWTSPTDVSDDSPCILEGRGLLNRLMCADTFYDQLPVLDEFAEVAEPKNYAAIPEDWFVAVASVQDSTEALEEGLYTAVNVVGVSVIAAVLNALGQRNIPYVFAGDGALLCVPEPRSTEVARALAGTRRMARERFGLHLCVGLVPMEVLLEKQRTVKVACYRRSDAAEQNVFVGRGLQFAEAQVENHPDGPYTISPSIEGRADFSGLRCQWTHVPSRKDEIVVLLVQPTTPALSERAQRYGDIRGTLQEVYGGRTDRRPVYLEERRHSPSSTQQVIEFPLQSRARKPWRWVLNWGHVGLEHLRRVFPLSGTATEDGKEQEEPRTSVAARMEFEALEGKLREVMAGTAEQRRQLEAYLRAQYAQGHLLYGHSCSDSALLTCLMFRDGTEHVHFVDGAKGGYARAARALRARTTALQRRQS